MIRKWMKSTKRIQLKCRSVAQRCFPDCRSTFDFLQVLIRQILLFISRTNSTVKLNQSRHLTKWQFTFNNLWRWHLIRPFVGGEGTNALRNEQKSIEWLQPLSWSPCTLLYQVIPWNSNRFRWIESKISLQHLPTLVIIRWAVGLISTASFKYFWRHRWADSLASSKWICSFIPDSAPFAWTEIRKELKMFWSSFLL